jgi:hypothetical protein
MQDEVLLPPQVGCYICEVVFKFMYELLNRTVQSLTKACIIKSCVDKREREREIEQSMTKVNGHNLLFLNLV